MLNRSASLAMSTSVLKALPGKFDIKTHSPSILYVSRQASRCQQAFSKPCLVNLISKDTHLVFSMFWNSGNVPIKDVLSNFTFKTQMPLSIFHFKVLNV